MTWQAQKKQPFGKDNLSQTFMTEPVLLHIVLPVLKSGFLSVADIHNLSRASRPIGHFLTEYQRDKDLDWTVLNAPNTHWQTQKQIDDDRVDRRQALLFHYDLDLVAVHRHLGNHVGAHHDHATLLARVKHLLPPKPFRDLRPVLLHGSPAKFNVHGTHQEFQDMHTYGNHPTVSMNVWRQ